MRLIVPFFPTRRAICASLSLFLTYPEGYYAPHGLYLSYPEEYYAPHGQPSPYPEGYYAPHGQPCIPRGVLCASWSLLTYPEGYYAPQVED